ncbi:MAG: protoporphyrinogen oxidase [Planctomycetota bacterium]|jgi:oxygen-dependent protoporphyrinogen oxidase|nr:MAG: protoporphyrinogen oxidase [Planctomycetota bacterium]
MASDQQPCSRIVVIGAGLAGLAAAEALASLAAVRVTVIESAGRHGGVLGTVRRDGWLVERSADCFLAARPEGIDLVARLGLTDELLGVDPRVRRALVWHEGRALPVPRGFRLLAPGRVGGVLATPLLSPWGRLRLLGERFVPVRSAAADDDESLQQFAVRRLGREAFERLVQPLAAGIWTADPARLSMAAACPEFLAMERDQGSLWAGERRRLAGQADAAEATGARYGQFVTFAGGMETLPARLIEHLRERGVEFMPATAARLRPLPGRGWEIDLAAPAAAPLSAAAVVVATSARGAAALIGEVDAPLAADLAAIEYAGSAIVSLGFAREQVAHPLDAAGLVVPRRAGRRILAVSFSSSKFPGRAPPGCVLMRVFVGGALDPQVLRLGDDALVEVALHEVGDLLGARGTPRLAQVDRWESAMPQYHLGHAARVVRIAEAAQRHAGLALAGAAYTGVGIPQVIASGRAAACSVAAAITTG